MSFHGTVEEGSICLEEGHLLKARLRNTEGEYLDAEIDLNTCIGNDNGAFFWGGENFSHSAENITFSLEGDEQVPILRAELKNVEDEACGADKNLAEHISNDDGAFRFAMED